MTTISFQSGWKVKSYDDYLHLTRDGAPGYITVKKEDEGFVVDIWPDEGNESVATTYAFFTELEPE